MDLRTGDVGTEGEVVMNSGNIDVWITVVWIDGFSAGRDMDNLVTHWVVCDTHAVDIGDPTSAG